MHRALQALTRPCMPFLAECIATALPALLCCLLGLLSALVSCPPVDQTGSLASLVCFALPCGVFCVALYRQYTTAVICFSPVETTVHQRHQQRFVAVQFPLFPNRVPHTTPA
jgi:hypothetical protein